MSFDPKTLERYRLKLRYKACYHLGRFCPDVDDVVQETLARFLRAQQNEKIHNPENPGAYLNGICNNVIQEYRRRLWREPLVETDRKVPEKSVLPEAEFLELRQSVGAALTQLSDRDRSILRDFYLQEKDKDEICRSMDLSDNQFRVALFRAKDRFRKIYREKVKHQPSGKH